MDITEFSSVIERKEPVKINKIESEKIIARQRERDSTMVTGIFRNRENPSDSTSKGFVSFCYRAYPGDDIVRYKFFDGEIYTIPLGVAEHLNNNCSYNQYRDLDGSNSEQRIYAGYSKTTSMSGASKVNRFSFNSVDFGINNFTNNSSKKEDKSK
jgi:hypothetical protein